MTVSEVSVARRTVKLAGTAANMSLAFGIKLEKYGYEGRTTVPVSAPLNFPKMLPSPSEPFSVWTTAGRPSAFSNSDRNRERGFQRFVYTASGQSLYQFPLDVDGAGQTVGILELGGGYKTADLKNYFSGLGIKEPEVVSVSVDGGKNTPTNAHRLTCAIHIKRKLVEACDLTRCIRNAGSRVRGFGPNSKMRSGLGRLSRPRTAWTDSATSSGSSMVPIRAR